MASSVSSVYLHVMQDVISNVRADFQSESVDESVLHELQSLWEAKMLDASALLPSEIPPHTRNVSSAPVQDLNIPYTGGEEFTPTAEMLFSPYSTSTPGPDQTPVDRNRGGVDMNIAYVEAAEDDEGIAPVTKDFLGKRKRDDGFYPGNYVPQHDGADDSPLQLNSSSISQHDGADDNYNDVAQEDYNETAEEEQATEAPTVQAHAQADADSEASEPPLNEEDDDDELNDIDRADAEFNTAHIVLAQFEKVTRSKNKWKCVLKDGIMRLNNRDILFVKANGEFEF